MWLWVGGSHNGFYVKLQDCWAVPSKIGGNSNIKLVMTTLALGLLKVCACCMATAVFIGWFCMVGCFVSAGMTDGGGAMSGASLIDKEGRLNEKRRTRIILARLLRLGIVEYQASTRPACYRLFYLFNVTCINVIRISNRQNLFHRWN